MGEWQLSQSQLKQYPHFDKPLSVREAIALATDTQRVKSHGFFPFIRFEKSWTRFRHDNGERKKKTRYLRYAARGDAYIYSYYRHILSERYEELLVKENLSANVVAYRKVPIVEGLRGGKSNIHFAKDAFDFIASAGNCCAVALDISSYFECIDHARLKAIWARLLGVSRLPDDHFQVFKSITSYTEVDRCDLYMRLGFLKRGKNGRPVYSCRKDEMPRQICLPADFREKVANDGPHGRKLVMKNKNTYGIPQGAAISDLLANVYLLEFDRKMAQYARKRKGLYLRYSDDILIAVPGDGRAGRHAREYACKRIRSFGDQLRIKPEKSSTVRFRVHSGVQRCERVGQGSRTDGLEYLGFRFDGKSVYFRDSTLTNLNRKIKRAARAVAHSLVSRYPGKDATFIESEIDVDVFMQKFGRVEDFEESADYTTWTFWSYAKKAGEVFGSSGQPIFLQLKGHRAKMARLLNAEVTMAIAKRRRPRGRISSKADHQACA